MATHQQTGVEVAIKIISKARMRNKHMISKVKREIRILKYLSHPNIIKLYEVLDSTHDIFVVMELASEGELFDLIHSKALTPQHSKFIFGQILEGLSFAHERLISHRDLKPENILIARGKRVKIADFGLANLMKDGRPLKTSCGSPNYAAPEVISKEKYEGTSVDIWSCGVILYALTTGDLPFEEETIHELYHKIRSTLELIQQSTTKSQRGWTLWLGT